MKILLLLVGLAFLTQLWTAVIRGKNREDATGRIFQAGLIWIPLVAVVALAAFTRRDWTALVLGVLAIYIGMAFWQRRKRTQPRD
jgi:1,4-dihydroxy-2-naphthoate octaprenyltransferase